MDGRFWTAPVCGQFAIGVFKLNRRVVDMEAIAQDLSESLRMQSLSDGGISSIKRMATQRMRARSEAPDVNVVHVEHTGHFDASQR